MTPFKNQEKLLSTLTSELCSLDHPKSWNIVIPPYFYTGYFASSLYERFKKNVPAARVALIAADSILSPTDLVCQIYYQWTGQMFSNEETNIPPNVLLNRLLASVGAGRNILIIIEFHKILGKMDERILVALRVAEQAGLINTIAISMYPHNWLRDKWKKEGYLLHVSNYGDYHYCLGVEPYSDKDIRRLLSKRDVPDTLATMLCEWTGGLPECLDRIVEDWISDGRPNLTPQIVNQLRDKVCDSLGRFVKFIDTDGSYRFSQLIIDIHRHIKEAENYQSLSKYHPWAKFILDEDGLRIDTLGEALTKAQMEEAFRIGKIAENLSTVADFAIHYYRIGQYDLAIQVIQKYSATYNSDRLYLIELHSKIMQCLCGGISKSSCPNVDTEWSTIIRTIVEARTVMLKVVKEDEVLKRELLHERYNEIEELAILASEESDSGGRYLDRIGGLNGDKQNKDLAFAMVIFQCETGRSISGNTAACKSVIELPEQVIRLWGYWKHGINYYNFPDNGSEIWANMLKKNPPRLTETKLPEQGKAFPSLYTYCYYIFALEDFKKNEVATWETQKNIDQELSMLEMRNDISHATIVINAKARKKLFNFIDTWINRLELDCMGKINRKSVMSKVDPLEVF